MVPHMAANSSARSVWPPSVPIRVTTLAGRTSSISVISTSIWSIHTRPTGGLREAARLAASYADATTAKVAVVTGKAVGPAWVALCNADLTIAVEGCTIAPLAPQAAVSVLYKEELDASGNIVAATQKKAAQWAAETCSAAAALQAGLADFAVPAADARAALVGALDMLSTKRTQRLPKKHGNMAL